MDIYNSYLQSHILEFFNAVREPEEIIQKIKDDPEFGAPRGRGVRMALARRILAARAQLPDGKFVSISQIEEIRGVGPDTCHDIAFTFAQILLTPDTPSHVKSLQQYYGGPSQNGMGTAVFFKKITPALNLEEFARLSFQYFLGSLREKIGERMFAEWYEVWHLESERKMNIINILHQKIPDEAYLLLENIDDAEAAQAQVASVFDDPSVIDLHVYHLGDEDIFTGVLVAGMRENKEATVLLGFYD